MAQAKARVVLKAKQKAKLAPRQRPELHARQHEELMPPGSVLYGAVPKPKGHSGQKGSERAVGRPVSRDHAVGLLRQRRRENVEFYHVATP